MASGTVQRTSQWLLLLLLLTAAIFVHYSNGKQTKTAAKRICFFVCLSRNVHFCCVAPSVRSYECTKMKRLTIVHGFWPKIEYFDFGKKNGCHLKGHLKRSRMAQISAS